MGICWDENHLPSQCEHRSIARSGRTRMMMSLIRSTKEHEKQVERLVEKLVEIEQESALRAWASRMLRQSCKLPGRRESYEAARSQCVLVTMTPVNRNKKSIERNTYTLNMLENGVFCLLRHRRGGGCGRRGSSRDRSSWDGDSRRRRNVLGAHRKTRTNIARGGTSWN
jgi:hypothetical protein